MNEGYMVEKLTQRNQPESPSAAIEIVQFTAQLGKRAQDVAERMNIKLQSVMRDANPSTSQDVVQKEYPPLFATLRNDLLAIEQSLNVIENSLLRTEL